MNVVYGNLLGLAQNGQFDVIVHGCNCQCTMGAGIAKDIKRLFPEAYDSDLQTIKGDKSKLGSISSAEISRFNKPLIVVNAYTQFDWRGYGVKVDYSAIRSCFSNIKRLYSSKRIGYPLIGAGKGGGEWSIIKTIIDEELHGEQHFLVEFASNNTHLSVHRPKKLISGGQSGSDSSALLAGERCGIETGGWAPNGYRTEKGCQVDVLKHRFRLIEHSSKSYSPRTNNNVRDSDATLIFSTDEKSRGTQQTVNFCIKYNKDYLLLNPFNEDSVTLVSAFLNKTKPRVLNVAGNRARIF